MGQFNKTLPHKRYLSLLAIALSSIDVNSQNLQCEPCINRQMYRLKAIIQGDESDEKWQRMKSAALQSGKDMGVNLEVNLYDSFSEDDVVNDIQTAIKENVDALIVSINSEKVKKEIDYALAKDVPVFGISSGSQYAGAGGIVDFFGMDPSKAGEEAANEMIKIKTIVKKALFIHDGTSSSKMDYQYEGYKKVIEKHASNMNEVAEVEMRKLSSDATTSDIVSIIGNCDYDAVLVSGSKLVEASIKGKKDNGCSFALGTFDTNERVYEAIGAEHLDFAISDQPFLSGSFPVLMASIFATTGKKIVPPTSKTHIYETGPKIITLDNLPSNTIQTCQAEGFPICSEGSDSLRGNNGQCKCTDRKDIKIGGVLHGVTTDTFWDPVFAATKHAANDMGIDLILDRFDPVDDQEVLHEKMKEKMIDICEMGVDGLFVTIPSSIVTPGLERCKELNVPIVSINTGKEISEELSLFHHVGMLEYNAGYGAGKRLISKGMKRGLCLDHEPGNTALIDRCRGFGDAIDEVAGIEYLGKLDVPLDNSAMYKKKVEDEIGEEGDWEGIGLFLLGPAQTNEALIVQEDHKQVIMGSVDTSDEIYKAIDENKLLFGITQGPYMQGYMPIPMLTWLKYTKQSLNNQLIESGPTFIETSPSEALQICEMNYFEVCPTTGPDVTEATTTKTSVNQTALIASLVTIFGVLFIIIGFIVYRVSKLNKHIKVLENEGKAVPDLSFQQKMASVVTPVESVVSARMA